MKNNLIINRPYRITRTKIIFIIMLGILITCKKENVETNSINTVKIKITQQSDISFKGVKINSITITEFNQAFVASETGLYVYRDGVFSKLEINGISNFNDVFYYNSEIIASTNKGVVLIDNINGYIPDKALLLNKEYSGIISNIVNTSFINERNVYWFGTETGACFLRDTIWTCTLDKNIKEINVTSITNRDTDYYIGTKGSFLFHIYYDNEIDGVTRASQMEIGYNGDLTSDTIYDVYVSTDDYLWFGSTLGLTKQKGLTKSWLGEFYYYLEGEHIISIAEDNNSIIWAGSNNGIWKQIDTTWQNISVKDGLSGNTIYSIAVDENDKVWIGTNNGISTIKGDLIENY